MGTSAERTGLLFICMANSIRSQIAEAVARHVAPDGVEVYSAGVSPGRVSTYALRVLAESGIDASEQYSKPLSAVPYGRIATVITLCRENLDASLPPGPKILRWPLDDPAAAARSEEELLEALRRVRDDLESRLNTYFAESELR
jgi:arsenate reductase